MAGRAGRTGCCEDFGRSILIAKDEKEVEMLWSEYVNAPAEKVKSMISKGGDITLPILGLISSDICKTMDELIIFLKDTYFGYTIYQNSDPVFRSTFQKTIESEVNSLYSDGFLELEGDEIKATEFGKRCAEGSLSPKSAKLIGSALKKIESNFIHVPYEELTEKIIHTACCTHDVLQGYVLLPVDGQERQELLDHWESNEDAYLVFPEDQEIMLRSIKTTQMLLKWIKGTPYSKLIALQGQVKRIAETIGWIVQGIARISEKPLFDFDDKLIEFLNTLTDRVYFVFPIKLSKL